MKTVFDLSSLQWTLEGFTPQLWRSRESMELGLQSLPEVDPVPAKVPGSVQQALLTAGVIPDWNVGLEGRKAEWVENRSWIFSASLPAEWFEGQGIFRLRCLGLDYSGWVLFNGKIVGQFENTFVPHVFDLAHPKPGQTNNLAIVFDLPPRWLGQFGFTSAIEQWKTRFNYTWDWTARMVQIGIWDNLYLECVQGTELYDLRVSTDYDPSCGKGALQVCAQHRAPADYRVRLTVREQNRCLFEREFSPLALGEGLDVDGLEVEAWWPNGLGEQPLYELTCELCDPQGNVHDRVARTLGFKKIRWEACLDAPPEADPWLCTVNEQPVFLCGVNWTPIRTNYADLTYEDYRQRIQTYHDLGFTVLRVWGGAFLEREWFYELCDQHGLLVWQELPLSSSGLENWPPESPVAIEQMCAIARSYAARRAHHASLLLWCGGNELTTRAEKNSDIAPCDGSHPMLAALAEVMAQEDPAHRFLLTSPTGPNFIAKPENYGQGVHWDIHGPWRNESPDFDQWETYWAQDDSLMRSEAGCPGASSAQLIERYAGKLPTMPATPDNPLWRRTWWWCEWHRFAQAHEGREPVSLEEYTQWSQQRQARALSIATQYSKKRFPGIGGLIFWMGHDCFPCTANTSLLDFEGRPKPAALAVAECIKTISLHQKDGFKYAVQHVKE